MKTLFSPTTLKLKHLFCSFLNVNFILGWPGLMKPKGMPIVTLSICWYKYDSLVANIIRHSQWSLLRLWTVSFSGSILASLDDDTLLSNILLDETINILMEKQCFYNLGLPWTHYTHFHSYMLLSYKFSLVSTIIFPFLPYALTICPNPIRKFLKLKKIL